MSSDDKPVYVTLDAMIPGKTGEATLLVRRFPATALDSKVEATVQKLLDPEQDSLNQPYNAAEREVADTVRDWFKKMQEDPENYAVAISAIGSDGKPVPMQLKDKLSDAKYAPVIKVKEEKDPTTGLNERYRLVDLAAQRSVPGGCKGLEIVLIHYE